MIWAHSQIIRTPQHCWLWELEEWISSRVMKVWQQQMGQFWDFKAVLLQHNYSCKIGWKFTGFQLVWAGPKKETIGRDPAEIDNLVRKLERIKERREFTWKDSGVLPKILQWTELALKVPLFQPNRRDKATDSLEVNQKVSVGCRWVQLQTAAAVRKSRVKIEGSLRWVRAKYLARSLDWHLVVEDRANRRTQKQKVVGRAFIRAPNQITTTICTISDSWQMIRSSD